MVDAAEGPLPQTRFVLRKALARNLPVILVINKVDRADARTTEVIDEVYELFFDLDAKEHQVEFPIVYCSGRDGWATLDLDEAHRIIAEGKGDKNLAELVEILLDHIPSPTYHEGAPAPGVGHQPRRVAVPRSPRVAAHHRGRDQEGPVGRVVQA